LLDLMVHSSRVTAVIPTRNRPGDVVNAVRSALAQSVRDLEVVVVLDGEDPVTRKAVRAIADPRVRLVELSVPRGAGGARNAGVEAVRSDWVAFLDDDDVWLPHKLELQLARADGTDRPVIVACRMETRTDSGSEILPRRLPAKREALSDYLFVRRGWRKREGILQTSMLLARTDLMRRVRFREDLRYNDETDWALRAVASGAPLAYVDAPLGVWNDGSGRSRLTHAIEWRSAVAWIRSVRPFVTPTAYAAFLLIWAADAAIKAGQRAPLPALLREALRDGSPRAKDLLLFAWIACVPVTVRRLLRGIGRAPVRARPSSSNGSSAPASPSRR
jgi:glycosyltransferase involved in cell wall biosynthesis